MSEHADLININKSVLQEQLVMPQFQNNALVKTNFKHSTNQ